MVLPLLGVPGQNRDSDSPRDSRPRRGGRTATNPRLVGIIAGTVTVAQSNEPLEGVTVQIDGTQLGANTNAAARTGSPTSQRAPTRSALADSATRA
jgi:hypothetical protein